MPAERDRITYRDYLQLPEETRYEVLAGDLCMVPAPSYRHNQLVGRIYKVLSSQVEEKGLGGVNIAPCDVVLADDAVVQPDVLVILREILSPANAHRDRGVKRRLYGRYGVKEYWIVDPDALTVEVAVNVGGHLDTFGLFGAGDRVQSRLLPSLDLAVDLLKA
ncbi:MAG TPA: Uma2 family endonuclease [Symbiobacteriaceae bacterium]|nr:Uma2 family endonuclease [Symbiobacteriaceae bacterium]